MDNVQRECPSKVIYIVSNSEQE